MAPRRPRKNVEAVESLIRNPSQKSFFFAFENQKVTRNLLFPTEKLLVTRHVTIVHHTLNWKSPSQELPVYALNTIYQLVVEAYLMLTVTGFSTSRFHAVR